MNNPQTSIKKQQWAYAGVRVTKTALGLMNPPTPFLNPFDWIAYKKNSVDTLRATYQGPFACRWCRNPVDYVDSDLTFTENALYHLLEEDGDACVVLRHVVKGGKL